MFHYSIRHRAIIVMSGKIGAALGTIIGKAENFADDANATIIALPRVFGNRGAADLRSMLGTNFAHAVTAIVAIKTGKEPRLGLKNRELNKTGIGLAYTTVVLSTFNALAVGHELYARWIEDRNFIKDL